MRLHTRRLILRDFAEPDRPAFLSYQTDTRYRRLYGQSDSDDSKARQLFDLFLTWRRECPRRNFQLGVFERSTGRLCGCAGLRGVGSAEETAVLGIELTPDDWGRYRLAIEIADTLLKHAFRELGLHTIVGSTATGNRRVERLARWFGARIVAHRPGPEWMSARGWRKSIGPCLATTGRSLIDGLARPRIRSEGRGWTAFLSSARELRWQKKSFWNSRAS